MRNSKMKGFTLIELIVVIAIIGILAAILVPSMLGYVRNSRISQANANAKQVHTAVASVLTQLGISNYKWTTTAGANEATVTFGAPNSNGVIECDWSTAKQPDDGDTDLVSYLGTSFTGKAKAWFNTSTYSVDAAAWTAKDLPSKITDLESVKGITEAIQKSDAKGGELYGIYPAPVIGAGGTKSN